MVLESIITPMRAERKPIDLLFIGMLYSSLAIIFSLWIFRDHSSLVMVFLTVIALVPLTVNTMRLEERKDEGIRTEVKLLQEHARAIEFFMFLFLGMVIAYTIWYIFLPADMVQNLFNIQTQTIKQINGGITGLNIDSLRIFNRIFLNNVRVLVFCILFSFLYGAGAIFILTWNASVIAAAIGNSIRSTLGEYLVTIGTLNVGHYFQIVSYGFMRYALHGMPEIAAYFVGALAGGIISFAIIHRGISLKNFEKVLFDTSELLLISLILLFSAALLEVYVTPVFF